MTLKNDKRVTSFNGPQIIPLDHYFDDVTFGGDTVTNINDDDEHDDDEIDSLLKEAKIGGELSNNNNNNNMNDHRGVSMNRNEHFGSAKPRTATTNSFRQRISTAVKKAFNYDADNDDGMPNTTTTTTAKRIRGFIRSKIGLTSTTRNFKIIATLAVLSLMVIIYTVNTKIMKYNHGMNEDNSSKSPHIPSYGGTRNSNHYVQNDNNDDDSWYTKYIGSISKQSSDIEASDINANDDTTALPLTSNVGISTVRSVSKQNLENKPGHYIHDPINNPYTSPYYAIMKANVTLQHEEQIKYENKMNYYRTRYGQWISPNFPSTLVQPDFLSTTGTTTFTNTTPASTTTTNMDLPIIQFPSNAWQSNSQYVHIFLEQAKSLIARVKEGIYEEYGYGILDITSTKERDQILKQRLEFFQVHIGERIPVHNGAAVYRNGNKRNRQQEETEGTVDERNTIPAIAYLSSDAWEGLIRKLLHCMMTQDIFYTVLVGHTNTYLGNNFQQSAIMEFNTVMEPIFDKLGMTLISRNMGMNATTTNSALGGSDIYGEADILWHVPDPRSLPSDTSPNAKNVIKESYPMIDFLFRQAILSGERVPIILSPDSTMFLNEMNHKVWMGNVQPGAKFCEDTDTQNGRIRVLATKACQFVKCRSDPRICDRHNSVCWVDRSDRNVYGKQDKNVGHQREAYPSVQQQRLEGRKLSMLILHAMDEALDRWLTQTNQNVVPLPDDMWHVSKKYKEVREHVRTTNSGLCGRFLRRIDPRICHMEMHAYTEWTPRVDPLESRLKALVTDKTGSQPVADIRNSQLEVYGEVALSPPKWKIDDNDIDVHMIAIATDTNTSTLLAVGKKQVKVQVNDQPKIYSDNDDEGTMAEMFLGDDDATNKDNDLGFGNYGTDDGNRIRKLHSYVNNDHRDILTDSDVSQTNFWSVYNAPIGFCDGSAQSTCNRDGSNTCLLANFNHYRAGLIGHGQSGKLTLALPNVREGIILAKFDWQEPNGPRVRNYAPDFAFDYTVNGVWNTMDRIKFLKAGIDLTQDLRVHVLMMDKEFAVDDPSGQTVVIEMEVRSTKAGTLPLLLLTHLYYA